MKGLSLYAVGEKDRTGVLFATSVNRLSDWLSAKQTGTAMWGDMLLEDSRWMSKVALPTV